MPQELSLRMNQNISTSKMTTGNIATSMRKPQKSENLNIHPRRRPPCKPADVQKLSDDLTYKTRTASIASIKDMNWTHHPCSASTKSEIPKIKTSNHNPTTFMSTNQAMNKLQNSHHDESNAAEKATQTCEIQTSQSPCEPGC